MVTAGVLDLVVDTNVGDGETVERSSGIMVGFTCAVGVITLDTVFSELTEEVVFSLKYVVQKVKVV